MRPIFPWNADQVRSDQHPAFVFLCSQHDVSVHLEQLHTDLAVQMTGGIHFPEAGA
jgi:hypothetical protein